MSDICKDFQDGYCRLGKKCRKNHSFLIVEFIKGSLNDDREEMKYKEYFDEFVEESATMTEDKEHTYDSCESKGYMDSSEDSVTMVEDKNKDYYDLNEGSDITIEDTAYYDVCDITIGNPAQYDLSEECEITIEDTNDSDLNSTKESIGHGKETVTTFEYREDSDDKPQTNDSFNTLESTDIVETKEYVSDRGENKECLYETKENFNSPGNTHIVDIYEIKEAVNNPEGTDSVLISEAKEVLSILKDKSLEGFFIVENKTITKGLENLDTKTEKDSNDSPLMGNVSSRDTLNPTLNKNDGNTEESTNEPLCDSITTPSVIDGINDNASVSDLNNPYANNEFIDDSMGPIDGNITNQDSEPYNNTNGNIESEQEDSYINITNSQEEYYDEDAGYLGYSSNQMKDEEHSLNNEDMESQTISDKPSSLLSGYAESPILSRPLPLQTASLIQNTFPQQSTSNVIISSPLSTLNINNSSSNPNKSKPSFRFCRNTPKPAPTKGRYATRNKPTPLNAPIESKPAIICADYSRGRCYKADRCQFNHPVWMNVRQKGFIDETCIGTPSVPRVLNTKRGEGLVSNNYYKEGSIPNRNANDRIEKTTTKPKGSTLQEYNELRQEIRADLLKKKPSWPFSGYNPTDKTYSVFKGDISPEELRFTAYIEIYCKGKIGNYNKTVRDMKSKVNANIESILKEVNSIAKTIRTMEYSRTPIWKSIRRKEDPKVNQKTINDMRIIDDMKSTDYMKECVAFEYGKIPETPPE